MQQHKSTKSLVLEALQSAPGLASRSDIIASYIGRNVRDVRNRLLDLYKENANIEKVKVGKQVMYVYRKPRNVKRDTWEAIIITLIFTAIAFAFVYYILSNLTPIQ